MGQIEFWLQPESAGDPSGLGHGWMVLIKAVLLSLAILGAFGAIKRTSVELQ
jgi:hypothetical protein